MSKLLQSKRYVNKCCIFQTDKEEENDKNFGVWVHRSKIYSFTLKLMKDVFITCRLSSAQSIDLVMKDGNKFNISFQTSFHGIE